MGIFDFIEEQFQKYKANMHIYQEKAKKKDVRSLCRDLSRASIPSEMIAYSGEIRIRCEEMNEPELKAFFDEVYDINNIKACVAIFPIMEKRGFAYKDTNGRMVRTYR